MKLFNWKNIFIFSIAILPFSPALNPTPTIDLSLVRLLFPAIFLIWLFSALFNQKLLLDNRPRFWMLTVFLFFCTSSWLVATDKDLALTKVLFLLSFFPVYFLTYAATCQKTVREKLLKALVFGSFLSAVFALMLFAVQFIFGIDPALALSKKTALFFLGKNFSAMVLEFPSWLVNVKGETLMRTFGPFPDPHLFSLFINLTLPFAFYFWKKQANPRYLLVTLVLLVASLLSFSRAAYLALLLGGIFSLLLFHSPVYLFKKYFSSFIGVLFLFFLLVIFPNPLTQRFVSSFDLKEGSNTGRIEMWQLALKTTLEKPLWGTGIGNFARYNFPMAPENNPIYAHNLFLDFSAEIGIVGAAFLLLACLCPFFALDRKVSLLSKAVAIASFIFIVHSFFETPFYSIRVFPLFLLILAIKNPESDV